MTGSPEAAPSPNLESLLRRPGGRAGSAPSGS